MHPPAPDPDAPLPVLIVEDDPKIARLVQIHLDDLGYPVHPVDDGRTALAHLRQQAYSLVILDVMLPGLDGFEVCRQIRTMELYVPVLMLTARAEETDVVLGLEFGADDYLTKPFNVRELIARVRALLRRTRMLAEQAARPAPVLRYEALEIDLKRRLVHLDGHTLDLTAKEFDLLALFAANPGRVYTRTELLEAVWGAHFDGYDHTVNSLINRLRRKIEANPSNARFIKTVWGVGYRFTEAHELHA